MTTILYEGELQDQLTTGIPDVSACQNVPLEGTPRGGLQTLSWHSTDTSKRETFLVGKSTYRNANENLNSFLTISGA
jgi:hypothetical protein